MGVAAAAAVVLAVAPLTLVARQSSLEEVLRKATPAERALRLTVRRPNDHEGGAGQYQDLDRQARDGLVSAGLLPGTVKAVRMSGRAVTQEPLVLAGVDGLAGHVKLVSGRLPKGCDEKGCEVLRVAGEKVRARLELYDVPLRVVGVGRLDALPLGPLPPPAGLIDANSTFLVTDGVDPLLSLQELDIVPRVFMWTRVLDPGAVHPWNTNRTLNGLADAEAAFAGIVDDATVHQPTVPLRAEATRGRAAAAFALIAAGLAATVLLAFVAFAAAEQRDDVADELRRLKAMAARRRHLGALVLGEAAVPALVGVLAGAAIAVAATVVVAGASDWTASGTGGAGAGVAGGAGAGVAGGAAGGVASGAGASAGGGGHVGAVLDAGLLTSETLFVAVVLWLAATFVVAGVLAGGQSRSVRVALEAGCFVALGALVWQAAARGQVGAKELADARTVDPVLVLAPGAAALACGLIALRVVPPLLRALARAAEPLPVGPYLTLVAVARQPGRTAAAVAVVAVAGAAGTFALGHAKTLEQGVDDQAAYRTAADVRGLAPSPSAKPAANDSPIVRIEAEGLGQPLELQLLGVSAPLLAHLPGWRPDFSDTPIAKLAKRLDPDPKGMRLHGVTIPPDARQIELPVRVSGASAVLQLAIQRRDGTFGRLLPSRDVRPGRAVLAAKVPARDRGGVAIAFEVTASSGGSGTASLARVAPGTLTARLEDGSTKALTAFDDWMPATEGTFDLGTNGRRVFEYSIAGLAGYLAVRPLQPSAREPVPVLATPGLQNTKNLFARVPGGGQIRLRIVGRIYRMPTAPHGQVAVADVGRLFAALNTQYPGLASISERWRVGGENLAREGRELRLSEVRAKAHADAVTRGVVLALRILAGLGALVALAATALAVAASARDRGGEQAELEAIGVAPKTLRAQMVAGAVATAAVGLSAGLLGGAALTTLFPRLLALGADGRDPLPALVPAFPWAEAVTAAATLTVATLVVASALARRAFKGDAVGRLRG
ncbi:FtsX-like permease family protein [Solirubrobacter soli]|uniref:FtsX-like permease family protein n=1 Tax=Solirubrobacter soli TaxID=363832 RepID=UPI00146CCF82|nr:FtsX-like permease family protein [Solirubrobacter soli]